MADVTWEDLVAEQRVTNALLRAAFKDKLDAIVDELLDDRASVAIVSLLAEQDRPASDLTANAEKLTGLKERAIRTRLFDLVESGVIVRQGAGPSTTYRLGRLLSMSQVARIRSDSRPKEREADAASQE